MPLPPHSLIPGKFETLNPQHPQQDWNVTHGEGTSISHTRLPTILAALSAAQQASLMDLFC